MKLFAKFIWSIVPVLFLSIYCISSTSQADIHQERTNKIIRVIKGNITLVLNMKYDKKLYSESDSDLYWGLFTHDNYRCASMDITVDMQNLRIGDFLFSPLSNVVTASITRSSNSSHFSVHIAGGDAGAAYWATITFKYIKSRHRYEPVSRILRNAEFPTSYYEKSTYHMWW